MNNLNLLKKRDSFYEPTLESLRKNKISFKKNLLLYEIAIKKKYLNQLKTKVNEYIGASINSYYKIKVKSRDVSLIKKKNLILGLPNITPNGVVVPKKENIKSFLNIQNLIFKICKKYYIDKSAKKIEICEVRLMRSNKYNYDNTRFYSSSKIHSDTWSGNPCDAKVAMYIDGDKLNTIEFFKPKKMNKDFFNKKNNYDTAIKKYGFKKIKRLDVSKLTIFDQACLHRTVNKNRDLRLSLDFGITLINNKQKKTFIARYKKRFIEKNKKINLNQLIKILKPKSIHDKFN
jgi:hypothetical protein